MKLIKNAWFNLAFFISFPELTQVKSTPRLNTGSPDQFLQLILGLQDLITSLNRWLCKVFSITQFVHDTNTSVLLFVTFEGTIYRLSLLYIDNDHIRKLISGAQRYIIPEFQAKKSVIEM